LKPTQVQNASTPRGGRPRYHLAAQPKPISSLVLAEKRNPYHVD